MLENGGLGKFTTADIDPFLCTYLIYAFAVLDGSTYQIKVFDTWADIDNGGYSNFVALKRRNPQLKTMLAVGGWTDSTDGSGKYSRLVSSPQHIDTFVRSSVALLERYGFDGLDIDWEYPSGPIDKAGFTELMWSLRRAFDNKGLILSAAFSASIERIDQGECSVLVANDMQIPTIRIVIPY